MNMPKSRVDSVILLIVLVAAGIAAAMWWSGRTEPVPSGDTRSRRTLIVVVPGTYGNEGHWPTVVAGKVTFASEVRRAVGEHADIYPAIWSASVHHTDRAAAARELARTIDESARSYDRICLVGHSHGGNVALWAASQCTARIDTVVCLSTPHVHLVTRMAGGKEADLPVYCSPKGRGNIGTLVCICPDGDAVPDFWADAVTGLDDNTAISLTRPWAPSLGHPRLENDSAWGHLLGRTNVRAAKRLGIADDNLAVGSTASNLFATAAHRNVHSRRMGYAVGGLIRDGLSPQVKAAITSLVLAADEDTGEP